MDKKKTLVQIPSCKKKITNTFPWRSASFSIPSSLSSSHYHLAYLSPSSTQERAGNARWASSTPTPTTAAAARESSGAPSKPSKKSPPISNAPSSRETTTLLPTSLTRGAVDRFGVSLLSPPKVPSLSLKSLPLMKVRSFLLWVDQVIHLNKRVWIEDGTYPRFTMIGQSLGSVYLAWEALRKLTPLYFIDTSGYAFAYPLARLFGCKVVCYTHYPTISLDMISRVRQRSSMYNNDASIAKRLLQTF